MGPPMMDSLRMGLCMIHVNNKGFTYKVISCTMMGLPTIGNVGHGAADNRSIYDAATADTAAPDGGHCQRRGI